MSNAKGALVLLAELPPAKRLLGDKGYDADWLRDELNARGVRTCIPARSGRNRPASHNRQLYKNRYRIENAFARLKDWRGLAMRYTRCVDLFPSAIALAAAIIFWLPLGVWSLGNLIQHLQQERRLNRSLRTAPHASIRYRYPGSSPMKVVGPLPNI